MNFTFKNASIVSVNSGTIVLNVSGKTRTFADEKLVSAVDNTIVLDLPHTPLINGTYKTIHLGSSPGMQRTFIAKADTNSLVTYHITQCAGSIKSTGAWIKDANCRNATPEEIQELNDQLTAEGKRWNPETMQIEKLRWKPRYHESYYCIDLFPIAITVQKRMWTDSFIDSGYYQANNCFKTKEEAQSKFEQIKQVLANG